MRQILRRYVRAAITEINNDSAFSRGFGSLEKDRDPVPEPDDPAAMAAEEEQNPLLKAVSTAKDRIVDPRGDSDSDDMPVVNKARGRESMRTRRSTV